MSRMATPTDDPLSTDAEPAPHQADAARTRPAEVVAARARAAAR